MKTTILSVLAAAMICAPAMASDYIDTDLAESVTSEVFRYETRVARAQDDVRTVAVQPTARRVVVGHRPCAARRPAPVAQAPVAVKTHSEVIDHYQVYQPVVQYVPAGTYSTRRAVSPCNRCGM